jgi:hypothetical protein
MAQTVKPRPDPRQKKRELIQWLDQVHLQVMQAQKALSRLEQRVQILSGDEKPEGSE